MSGGVAAIAGVGLVKHGDNILAVNNGSQKNILFVAQPCLVAKRRHFESGLLLAMRGRVDATPGQKMKPDETYATTLVL